MNENINYINGIEICTKFSGTPSHPVMLFIMGG